MQLLVIIGAMVVFFVCLGVILWHLGILTVNLEIEDDE